MTDARFTRVSAEVWVEIDHPQVDLITRISAEVWVTGRVLGLTYPIYPDMPGLGYSVNWMPEFANLPTQIAANKAEIDLKLEDEPVHGFELTYEFLRNEGSYQELKKFAGFWLRIGGVSGRFLFSFPDDNTVTGEVIGTTDGSSTDYGPITRTFGDGDDTGTEAVGYINTDEPYTVYLDGTPVASDQYTFDTTYPKRQMISWLLPPSADQEITIDCSFYYYCKFADDTMTFEKFVSTMWEVKKVTLKSLRYGT